MRMRLPHLVCMFLVVMVMLIVAADAAAGKRQKKARKPPADAPMPTRTDDYADYDQSYYDSKEDSAANGVGGVGAEGTGDEDTTEVYRQPDDELPTERPPEQASNNRHDADEDVGSGMNTYATMRSILYV